jgi:hypothetical protein
MSMWLRAARTPSPPHFSAIRAGSSSFASGDEHR